MGKHGRVQIYLTPEAARVAARFPSISQAVNTALTFWGEKHPEGSNMLMNPYTGAVDTRENWLAEMATWETNSDGLTPEQQFYRLVPVKRDANGNWVEL